MKSEWRRRFCQQVVDTGIWAELPGIAQAVYPVLLTYAHILTKVCIRTQKTIAKDSGVYWKSVQKAVKILEKYKLIRVWISRGRLHYKILNPKTSV